MTVNSSQWLLVTIELSTRDIAVLIPGNPSNNGVAARRTFAMSFYVFNNLFGKNVELHEASYSLVNKTHLENHAFLL